MAGSLPSLYLSAFCNGSGWQLVVDKKHTGLVYNSRENSFPVCRCIHSVGVDLGIVHLSFMVRVDVDVCFGKCSVTPAKWTKRGRNRKEKAERTRNPPSKHKIQRDDKCKSRKRRSGSEEQQEEVL